MKKTTTTTETAHKEWQLPEWKVSEWMIFETGRKKAILEGIIDYYLYDVEETKQRLQLAASAPQLKAENDRLEILLHAKKTVIEILFKEIDTIKNQKAVLLDALKPFAELDTTGVTGEIVYQRNKTKITMTDMFNAQHAIEQVS